MLNIIVSFVFLTCSSCKEEVNAQKVLKENLISIAKTEKVPTFSVIVKSERINLSFNYLDRDKNIEPVIFYGLASTTKFLSALILLKKVEENKIELEDPVCRYIDSADFRNITWFKDITVRHLLNHTSGIPDYTKNPKWFDLIIRGTSPFTYEQKIALINTSDGIPLLGHYMYSNSNYVILEKIIETVCGKKSQQVFNDFFDKIGTSITFDPPLAGSKQAFFCQRENQVSNVTAWQEGYGFDGGAYGRSFDLSRVLRGVFVDKQFLDEPSLRSLATWTDIGGYKIDYGFAQISAYGLGLMKLEFNNRVFLGHAGSSLKYQCFAFIEPTTGVEIILQTNCSGKFYNKIFYFKLLAEIFQNI